MNKAFVREPDHDGEFCPRCGSLGQPVKRQTVTRFLPDHVARSLADPANFCPLPSCEVAYFDSFERVATADQLALPVYPKDPQAPLCACFGFTTADVDQDLAEGTKARTKTLLERAKSPEAQCDLRAPNGRCCAAEVQRYFLKRMNS